LLAAATGQELSLEEFLAVGERIWNLERLFNLGAGLGRADDALPGRCFEPIRGEKSEGARMEKERFEAMLDEYYAARGWDHDGVPTRATLGRLGIEEYARLAGQ
jgi:aldehyde:ferredoxin oxidoreductase